MHCDLPCTDQSRSPAKVQLVGLSIRESVAAGAQDRRSSHYLATHYLSMPFVRVGNVASRCSTISWKHRRQRASLQPARWCAIRCATWTWWWTARSSLCIPETHTTSAHSPVSRRLSSTQQRRQRRPGLCRHERSGTNRNVGGPQEETKRPREHISGALRCLAFRATLRTPQPAVADSM
jgi:hypothetical protein